MGSNHNGAYGSGLGLEQERALADVGGVERKRERERERERVRNCVGTNHRQKQLIKLCRVGNWAGVAETEFG
jgi:hypothetical protein